jgi:F0F1-type ATP synthase epsilon subunit
MLEQRKSDQDMAIAEAQLRRALVRLQVAQMRRKFHRD